MKPASNIASFMPLKPAKFCFQISILGCILALLNHINNWFFFSRYLKLSITNWKLSWVGSCLTTFFPLLQWRWICFSFMASIFLTVMVFLQVYASAVTLSFPLLFFSTNYIFFISICSYCLLPL